jgi:uncharacterized protein (DUF1501 family)
MKRRKFIQSATAGLVVPTVVGGFSAKAYAESPLLSALLQPGTDTDHVLVVIYLNGGNDGLNTLVPLDQYDHYVRARPTVHLPLAGLLPLNGFGSLAFHPRLGGFQQLFNEGKLTIVQSVGYDKPDFSHFRSTDIWASASDSDEVLGTGWLGRYLDSEYPGFPAGYPNPQNPDPLALQIGSNLPLLFQGPAAQMAMNLSNPDIFGAWPSGIDDPAPNTPYGKELQFIRTINRQSSTYADAVLSAFFKGNNLATYPAGNYLADVMKVIARLIKGGLKTRLYLVSAGGFDTHSDQILDQKDKGMGKHGDLLKMLGDASFAFQRDLEAMKLDDRVMGMTFSEFGRRIRDNASGGNGAGGTDHGAAAPMFLFGKRAASGVIGSNPVIPANVSVNDNLMMQYDFRSVYTSVLQQWLCVRQPALQSILLRDYQLLPLVKDGGCLTNVRELDSGNIGIDLRILTNPMVDRTDVDMVSNGGRALLQLFGPMGSVVKTLYRGSLSAGTHRVSVESEAYPPGNYYLRFQQQSDQVTRHLIIAR